MITKKILGLGLTVTGLLACLAVLSVDWLRAGNFEGLGPTQQIALIGAILIFLVGLSLIPLGDRPA